MYRLLGALMAAVCLAAVSTRSNDPHTPRSGPEARASASNYESARWSVNAVSAVPVWPGSASEAAIAVIDRIEQPASVNVPEAAADRGIFVKSGPVVYRDTTDVVIEGVEISNPEGNCIELWNVRRVLIRDSKIGPCRYGVYTHSSTEITITNLYFIGTAKAIYANHTEGIQVLNNTFVNAGRNFVQFNVVTGSNNRITGNIGRNSLGASDAEDLISLHQSSGTQASPIVVSHNRLRDGGPSRSGSGIMAGDGGGAHQIVTDNVLVNAGQVGVGVSGGTDIAVTSNRIYGDGHLWSNVGLYVWNQTSVSCSNIEVRGNLVEWVDGEGRPNGFWDGGNCGAIKGIAANDWSADLFPEIEAEFASASE